MRIQSHTSSAVILAGKHTRSRIYKDLMSFQKSKSEVIKVGP